MTHWLGVKQKEKSLFRKKMNSELTRGDTLRAVVAVSFIGLKFISLR